MTVSVYVAARFPDQKEARALRDALAAHGVGCTSRWLEEECSLGSEPTDEQKVKFARMDRYDVRRAQAVVLWNPEEHGKIGTGGCHVESGMAFMLAEMPVFVAGGRTNIFAWLPEAIHVPFPFDLGIFTFEQSVKVLARLINAECVDFGPTWDSPQDQARRTSGIPGLDPQIAQRASCKHTLQFVDLDRVRRCDGCGMILGGMAP